MCSCRNLRRSISIAAPVILTSLWLMTYVCPFLKARNPVNAIVGKFIAKERATAASLIDETSSALGATSAVSVLAMGHLISQHGLAVLEPVGGAAQDLVRGVE